MCVCVCVRVCVCDAISWISGSGNPTIVYVSIADSTRSPDTPVQLSHQFKHQPAIFPLFQHVIRFHELPFDTTQRFLQ